MPREKSAGAIIFRKENNIIYYLLLHYPSLNRKGGHWEFAKGHIEAGESDEDFAKRIDAGNGRRVVVMTDLDAIIADNSAFASLRDKENVFLAGIPYKEAGLDANSYLPIVELLREAVRLGLSVTDVPASSLISATPYERFKNVFRLLPKMKPFKSKNYNDIRVLYEAQFSA